jgi:heme O synthase-like polyprenyltransferase
VRKLTRALLSAVAALGLVLTPLGLSAAQAATVVPRHAIVICQSASFYDNYDSASGPYNLKRVLTYGNKIGHTPGAHPVYNGWAATFDFGPNDWGYLRIECIGGYDSW